MNVGVAKTTMHVAKTRNVLSMQKRLEIIKKLEKGISVDELSVRYSVHATTIRAIRRKAEQIKEHLRQTSLGGRKKIRKPVNEDLDNKLYAWFLERKAVGDHITSMVICEKALQLNKELGGPKSFKASNGWLWCFKMRHGIGQTNVHDEKSNVDAKPIDTFVDQLEQILQEHAIDFDNVYCVNETGLAWKSLPDKILEDIANKSIDRKEIKKHWFTLSLCANVTGSHKLPPLIIYKYITPRIIRKYEDSLPVIFKSQGNAWVDWHVFADWYQNNFKALVRKYQLENGKHGKILLIVDYYRRHSLPQSLQDDNVKIMFLPPNVTSIIQGMGQGIIETIKNSFRHGLLQRIMDFSGGVEEFYANYNIKDCINLLHNSWEYIHSWQISDSWRRLLKNFLNDQCKAVSSQGSIKDCQQLIETVTKKKISLQEVEDWLFNCDEFEDWLFNCDKVDDLPEDIKNIDHIKTENKMFEELVLWSKNHPNYVQLQVQLLKDYYDQTRKYK